MFQRLDGMVALAMTTGEESIMIAMLRDFRREVTERFDQLDIREDRQDDRLSAIEVRDTVAVAVAKHAAEIAVATATSRAARHGRTLAAATLAGTLGVASSNVILRVLGY